MYGEIIIHENLNLLDDYPVEWMNQATKLGTEK